MFSKNKLKQKLLIVVQSWAPGGNISLISADSVENAGITGAGAIDGGAEFYSDNYASTPPFVWTAVKNLRPTPVVCSGITDNTHNTGNTNMSRPIHLELRKGRSEWVPNPPLDKQVILEIDPKTQTRPGLNFL